MESGAKTVAIYGAFKAMSGEEFVYPALKMVHIC